MDELGLNSAAARFVRAARFRRFEWLIRRLSRRPGPPLNPANDVSCFMVSSLLGSSAVSRRAFDKFPARWTAAVGEETRGTRDIADAP